MMLDYSEYWFMIRTVRLVRDDSNETIPINHYFSLHHKQIASYETCIIGDSKYTLVRFDTDEEIIADRDVKRFKAEVLPRYTEIFSKYMNDLSNI
jgi:hypothetical protein